MAGHKIDLRANRDNARRIDRFVACVIVILDVLHINGTTDTGLLIQITDIAGQIGVVDDAPDIALEMPDIDGIEPH